jgi:O-antigen/teichoic acid export membrane protein
MTPLQLLRTVGQTFTAQLYNQLVTIGIQLVQVPLLLAVWGADRYGGWLVLYAIPSYLTLSDFGFTIVAKNNMVMCAAAGDRAGMLRVYHSVFCLLLIATAVIGGMAVAAIEAFPIAGLMDLGPIRESSAKFVLLTLAANVIANQFFLLFCAAVRASGRPAAEVMWGATGRLLEGVATVAAAYLNKSVESAALAILVLRSAWVVAIWAWLRLVAGGIQLGLAEASFAEIRKLANPSFSYSLLGLAQAIAIQGPILILGAVATAQDTAMFSTSRTLARIGTSVANVVNYSFSPEYSRLNGTGDSARFTRLERIHLVIGVAGILLYSFSLWWAGAWLMQAWTHHQIAVVYPFFGLLNAAVAAEMFWGCCFTPLAAVNRHVQLSYVFVALTVACAAPAYWWATWAGATGIAISLLILHSVMSILVLMIKPRMFIRHAKLTR